MNKEFKYDSSRREFIRKLNYLVALKFSGNILNTDFTQLDNNYEQCIDIKQFENNSDEWPKIVIKKNSKVSTNTGPNLTNLLCKIDILLSGNLKYFQIIGNETENLFVQVLNSTESFVNYKNQFYSLSESDEISYEYALSYIIVTFKIKELPFEVIKKIYIHPKYSSCVQHISIKKYSKRPVDLFFMEKAVFTLGDPFYTTYNAVEENEYTGFKVNNELSKSYFGQFLISGTGVTRIFTRNDQLNYQIKTLKSPWKYDENVYKCCDDQCAILQKEIHLASDNSANDFIICYSAAALGNEIAGGTQEIFSMFKKDSLYNIETKLHKKAIEYSMIKTPDQLLNQGFSISNKLSSQVFQSADGLVALPGHMYQSFYSRDSHWQICGLLGSGRFKEVKDLLVHFTKYQNAEGSFPTRINLRGQRIYHTGKPDLDSAALISLSIMEYVRWSKDTDFGAQNWKSIKASIDFLREKDIDNDGWIEQDYNQDWADRLKRNGKVNYTQCIYYKLLIVAVELGEILNKKEVELYKKLAARLKSNYDKMFWDEDAGFFIDYIDLKGKRMKKLSQDVCLAFIYGLTEDLEKIKRHLSKQKEKNWTKWGPKHHEGYKDANNYDPLGFYCNGGVWMWITAFEAYAHFQYGNPEDGITALNSIKEYEFGKNPYNEIYFDTTEWHDSANGLNCEFNWKECRNFTTGSGSHVWAILHGLFGLKLTMKGQIFLSPSFPKAWQAETVYLNNIRHGDTIINKRFIFNGKWE